MKKERIRKNIRLENYDYSQNGAYFVTMCIDKKHCILGEIVDDMANNHVGAIFCRPRIKLSDVGTMIEKEIHILSNTYNGILVDKYVIMPNHIHMIIINSYNGRQDVAPTLSRMIQHFKRSLSIKLGYSIWQKTFYDHIIRNEMEYLKIWKYIDENPIKWEEDKYYINQGENHGRK